MMKKVTSFLLVFAMIFAMSVNFIGTASATDPDWSSETFRYVELYEATVEISIPDFNITDKTVKVNVAGKQIECEVQAYKYKDGSVTVYLISASPIFIFEEDAKDKNAILDYHFNYAVELEKTPQGKISGTKKTIECTGWLESGEYTRENCTKYPMRFHRYLGGYENWTQGGGEYEISFYTETDREKTLTQTELYSPMAPYTLQLTEHQKIKVQAYNENVGLMDHFEAHKGDGDWDIQKISETCAKEGYLLWTCSVCKKQFREEFTPAAHQWSQWQVAKPVAGNANSIKTRKCEGCGKGDSAIIRYNPFTDVPSGGTFEKSILWAYHNDITQGKTATTFLPNTEVTRAQFVTFLWRAAGSPEPYTDKNPFTDIQEGKFYYKAVLWAVENGITQGKTATTFQPDAAVTRAQAVTFLYRFNGESVVSGNNPFTDIPNGKYYTAPVLWAYQNGITQGKTATTFQPDAFCNRAQAVTFLYRLLKK